jgi:hypothetical protein
MLRFKRDGVSGGGHLVRQFIRVVGPYEQLDRTPAALCASRALRDLVINDQAQALLWWALLVHLRSEVQGLPWRRTIRAREVTCPFVATPSAANSLVVSGRTHSALQKTEFNDMQPRHQSPNRQAPAQACRATLPRRRWRHGKLATGEALSLS